VFFPSIRNSAILAASRQKFRNICRNKVQQPQQVLGFVQPARR
jgi:hypothetical protein